MLPEGNFVAVHEVRSCATSRAAPDPERVSAEMRDGPDLALTHRMADMAKSDCWRGTNR
jgi:hypothetical protein